MNKVERYRMFIRLIALAAMLQSIPVTAEPPAYVGLVPAFENEAFANPEPVFWPAYFWLWNARLDEATLKSQLRDMAAHDARSVCMLPMPKGFRPDSTNNSMEPDYLTPEFLERVRFAVDEAAALGMNWWLYDEGGWPSGRALGKVTDGHDELTRRRVVREPVPPGAPFTVPDDALALIEEGTEPRIVHPGETWTPTADAAPAFVYRIEPEGTSDLLNPEATRRFISLTHEEYAGVLAPHFGKAVRFTFTDEPGAGMPRPPDSVPWTPGIEALWQVQTGTPIWSALPRVFAEPGKAVSPDVARARIEYYDMLTRRFADAYFGELESWGRSHGLASAGHLGGEDETFGAIKHSFGHVLRPLRRMDVPGVDLIWRQLFPGANPQSNFPVAAATAAHQNGTRFAFSESFCVYGNGLTPAQMKWLVDYQYVRGINLLVIGCYPLSTQDHHMTGERPHFGPMNPLWDHLPGFHAYVARLGFALSVGTPEIRTALYYPVRDMWAWGMDATEAVESFEALQTELLARQCAFDLIDDDMLSKGVVQDGTLAVGPMRYDTIVCGNVNWMAHESLRRLEELAQAGGRVLALDHVPGTQGEELSPSNSPIVTGAMDEILAHVAPSVILSPASRNIRAIVRAMSGQQLVMLFNEGPEPYSGTLTIAHPYACSLDPLSGTIGRELADDGHLAISLGIGDSAVHLLSTEPIPGAMPPRRPAESIAIADSDLKVTRIRQFLVGDRDFETLLPEPMAPPLPFAAQWKTWLGEDFSGEVDYTAIVTIPESWGTSSIRLETGPIEYAASVSLDGRLVGHLLWP
ncbi:MAG: hypothetical protein IT365_27750, partial [Candidatus Hydrogenedentes bacterium]|nr:hypothetical protein [Candidatus Hydrogenedentota bacterium]